MEGDGGGYYKSYSSLRLAAGTAATGLFYYSSSLEFGPEWGVGQGLRRSHSGCFPKRTPPRPLHTRPVWEPCRQIARANSTWLPGVGWEGNPQENLYTIKFFLSKYQNFPKTFESIFIFDAIIYLVIPLFAKRKINKSSFCCTHFMLHLFYKT